MAPGWLEDWLDETGKVQSPPLLFLAFFHPHTRSFVPTILWSCLAWLQDFKTSKTKLRVITYRYIRIRIYVDKHWKGTQNTKDNWWGKTVGNFSFFFNYYICEINWKGGKNLIRATGEEVGELGKSPWRTKKIYFKYNSPPIWLMAQVTETQFEAVILMGWK